MRTRSQNVTAGSHAPLRRPRKRCSSTGGIYIPDDEPDDFTFYIPKKDESLYEGYLVDDDGKVVGEARRYDPYSKFGEIMLYDIDSFGFLPGFISKGLRLMSEEDMMSDENLRKSLETAKYESWKRYNIADLIAEYDLMFRNRDFFETFCRRIYRDVLEKEKKGKS